MEKEVNTLEQVRYVTSNKQPVIVLPSKTYLKDEYLKGSKLEIYDGTKMQV